MHTSAVAGPGVVVVVWHSTSDQVLVERSGGHLPVLRVAGAGFGAGVPAAVSSDFGLDVSLLDHLATAPDIVVVATASRSCPEGFDWLPADIVTSDFSPPRAGEWLRQRHQPLRPWFAPDWYKDAVTYAVGVIESIGGQLTAQPYQVRHWPLSSVIRLTSSVGTFYLKSVPVRDVYEPELLTVLRSLGVPHLPPEPTARDDVQCRWMSPELSGQDGWSLTELKRAPAISALAELQQATMPHLERLETFGLQRWPVESMVEVVAEVVQRDDLWVAQPAPDERWCGLTGEQHRSWRVAESWLVDCCHRLADLADKTGIHVSLTHSDLHPGNTQLQQDGRVVVHDWSEAGLRHPFMDLGCWIDDMSDEGARHTSTATLQRGMLSPTPRPFGACGAARSPSVELWRCTKRFDSVKSSGHSTGTP